MNKLIRKVRFRVWHHLFAPDPPASAGQGLAEYGIILFFMVIVVIASLGVFGTALRTYYEAILDALPF